MRVLMTTSSPIRKIHDIPIVEPYKPPGELPHTLEPMVPIHAPVREPDYVPVPARRLELDA